MVWEWNNRGTDAKNHRRMDFTVREGHRLLPLTMQVSQTHGDHSRLFFFNVHEFDQALLTARLKVPLASLIASSIINYTTSASVLLRLV